MDSSFEGFMLDPSKCSKLSMEEKRDIVYEISKWSHGAPEMLQSWSRRELLQILCAEMGKERKYTGLTKFKMIEHLLRIVSEKSSNCVDGAQPEPQHAPANSQSTSKRQRKTHPSRLPIATNHFATSNGNDDQGHAIYCQNLACRATMHREDVFCKRCSCCICYQYDDNKDPSLWLVCCSEPPYLGNACDMSCHLDCALKHEGTGIAKVGQCGRLDGSFYCVSCGKVNDLLGCWRKQLMTAKDTRRVDILCYRVSLSQKLLNGTKKYQKLQEIVDTAARKLEAEVGPLVGLPVKMGRGIVNRLSSGPEIQRLCALAVESLDSMLSCSVLHLPPNPKMKESCFLSPSLLRFEDVCPTSLTGVLGFEDTSSEELVGYTLWHRKADVLDYPVEPTCTMFIPNTRFSVLDLAPSTEYLFKVVSFCSTRELGVLEVRITTGSDGNNVPKCLVAEGSQSPATNSSSLSNPPSEGDESINIIVHRNQNDNPTGSYLGYFKKTEKNDSGKISDDASKDASDSQNTSIGSGQEETLGDSVSALDEEREMIEVGPVPSTTIQTGSQRNFTNSNDGNRVAGVLKLNNKHLPEAQLVEVMGTDNGADTPIRKETEIVPSECGSEAVLPVTPFKLEIGKDGPGRTGRPKPSTDELDNGSGEGEEPQAGSSSKKRSRAKCDEECARDGSFEREYEYCVKVIRWLECEGHIEKNFRVKFLTWYSLRATPQEMRVVKVYVNTLIDDPASLAGQLVHTFSECMSSKRPLAMPSGFCMKLWH